MCVTADIGYPTGLSLLNEASEVTVKLISTIHPRIRKCFEDKPRTHRIKVDQQFLAVTKKNRLHIDKIRQIIQQRDHLVRNLASIDTLIDCLSACLRNAVIDTKSCWW